MCGKVLSAQLNGIDADVQQDLRTRIGRHADRVSGIEYCLDGAVRRGVQLALRRVDRNTGAHDTGSECLVGHLVKGHHRAAHVCAQHRILQLACGSGRRSRCCRCGRSADEIGCRMLQIVLQIGLDDCDLRTVDDLHAVALVDDAGCARLLQQRIGHLVRVVHGDAQTGRAAVEVGKIVLAAQTLQDERGDRVRAVRLRAAVRTDAGLFLEIGTGVEFGLLVVVLTTRGLEVHFADHKREGRVVEEEIDHADDDDPDPAGLGIALQDAEQREVDDAAREGHADTDAQNMHQHIGQTGIDAVHRVHQGRNEQEGELDGLGDAGEHGGQRRRDQQTADRLFLFRPCTAVHREGCAGQTEDHNGELARHEAGRSDREHLGALGCQLGKEDVLRALHEHAVDGGGAAECGLPEGHIEHMVQTEGDERTLDDAVDPGACIARARDQIAQQRDPALHDRPEIEHHDADDQIDRGGNDGHKAGAAEEGERLRQLGLIKAVVERCHAQTDDDAAEHAHLQGGDAEHRSGGVLCHGFHAACRADHCADGGVHDEIGDRTRKCGDLFFLFRHADGNAHRKEQGEVIEYRAAALIHNIKHGVQQAARINDAGQVVCLQHSRVGKRAADAEQQTGYRQQRDRQHERPSDTLQNAKNLIFHNLPPELVSAITSDFIS